MTENQEIVCLNPLKICLIGPISCGKSSFVNGIAGGIISSANIQRETIKPRIYHFKKRFNHRIYLNKITDGLEDIHKENKNKS